MTVSVLVYTLGVKDWISYPLGDGRALKNCPISTNLKPASEHSLDNFWSSDNFPNRCSYSCNGFLCRSSFSCNSARGGCVRISCSSSWPDATGFTGALCSTGIRQSYPPLLRKDWQSWPSGGAKKNQCLAYCHWSVSMSFLLLCFLNLLSPRNIGWPDPLKWSSIFSAVRSQDPFGFQS